MPNSLTSEQKLIISNCVQVILPLFDFPNLQEYLDGELRIKIPIQQVCELNSNKRKRSLQFGYTEHCGVLKRIGCRVDENRRSVTFNLNCGLRVIQSTYPSYKLLVHSTAIVVHWYTDNFFTARNILVNKKEGYEKMIEVETRIIATNNLQNFRSARQWYVGFRL